MSTSSHTKVPQRFVQVSYSVFEPPVRNSELCEPKVQIQPLTNFVQIPLIAAVKPFKEIQVDEALLILIPQQPLYPLSKFHVPVFLQQIPGKNISSFTLKARVKSGVKVVAATSSSDMWNVSMERDNLKHPTLRVTATKKTVENNTFLPINDKRYVHSSQNIILSFFKLRDSHLVIEKNMLPCPLQYSYCTCIYYAMLSLHK